MEILLSPWRLRETVKPRKSGWARGEIEKTRCRRVRGEVRGRLSQVGRFSRNICCDSWILRPVLFLGGLTGNASARRLQPSGSP